MKEKFLQALINGQNMSSNTTKFYLFNMSNGKKKLAYGSDPEDAYEILSWRLTQEEMNLIVRTDYVKVLQRDLQQIVDQLG